MKIILVLSCYLLWVATTFANISGMVYIEDTTICKNCGCTLDTIVVQNNPININNISYYKNNKAATIDEVLSQISEVNLIKRGAYGLEPQIRAFTPNQTLLLIDGMRIHGACTDKMDPASIYIEPQNLKSIQLNTSTDMSKGASLAGSINLQLKEPVLWDSSLRHFRGNVQVSYQTNANAWFASSLLEWSSKQWAITGNFTVRKAGNYYAGGKQKILFSQYQKINYNTSALYRINPVWNVKLDFIGDDGWNIGYPALTMDVGYANAKIIAASLIQQKQISVLQNIKIKIYANQILHWMDDTHRPNVLIHMDMPGTSKTAGYFAEGNILINPQHIVAFRADAAITQLNAWMIMYPKNSAPMYMPTLPKNNSIQSGISLQYTWHFLPQHALLFKERIDFYNNQLITKNGKEVLRIFYPNLKPSILFVPLQTGISYIYRPNEKWKLSMNGGMNQRVPTANELFGYYLFNRFDNYDYIGNPNLKNETAFQGELNAEYNTLLISFSVKVFASYIKNYIFGNLLNGVSHMTIGALGVKGYTQLPYGLLAGGEVAVNFRPVKICSIHSSFRYNYGQDYLKRPLPLVPPLKNITYLDMIIKQFTIIPEMQAALPQYRVNSLTGEQSTKGYVIFNLRANYEWTLKNVYQLGIHGAIENIFDTRYREHLDWGNINRPGRNFIIQIMFNW